MVTLFLAGLAGTAQAQNSTCLYGAQQFELKPRVVKLLDHAMGQIERVPPSEAKWLDTQIAGVADDTFAQRLEASLKNRYYHPYKIRAVGLKIRNSISTIDYGTRKEQALKAIEASTQAGLLQVEIGDYILADKVRPTPKVSMENRFELHADMDELIPLIGELAKCKVLKLADS